MTYTNNGKSYEVEGVELGGAIINVNGTSITDCVLMDKLTNNPYPVGGYTVFCDSDEVCFDTFLAAYIFATQCQKDTFSIKK